jgi:anti-sigma-K factor RskA
MATLRLTVAEVNHKERQLDALVQQFRTQLRRLPRQVIYGRTSLDLSLSAMAEIEERLADALATRRRLLVIKKSALEELEALELVRQVDEVRRQLQALREQAQAVAPGPEVLARIRELERFIAENSKRAELAITANYEERQQPG